MDVQKSIATLMTKEPITIGPKEKIQEAQQLFEKHAIHHLPVVENDKLLGLISTTDILNLLKGKSADSYEDHMNKIRLKNYTVEEIMTTGLATLSSTEPLLTALKVFEANRFHAIPIVDGGKLAGIISMQDIIKTLTKNS